MVIGIVIVVSLLYVVFLHPDTLLCMRNYTYFPYPMYDSWTFQIEVEFANGRVFKLSSEFLRINSPAVDGKIRSIGGEKVLAATWNAFQLHHLETV